MAITHIQHPYGDDRTPSFTIVVSGSRVTVSFETVTPELAEAYLAKNTHNRRIKTRSIAQMAEDIQNGDFKFNGDTICFAADGTLLDGQNRCHAIIEAGVPVPSLIVRGLAAEAQDDMDTGVKRGYHDVLTLKGETNAANLAALVRRVGAWEDGARRNLMQWKTSHSGLTRILNSHPELREFVQPAARVSAATGVAASNVGMLMWVFHSIDSDDAQFFFDRLHDGQGLVKGDPIFELRRTLAELRDIRGGNAQAIRHIVFIIKAWNAYRKGETVSLFRWKPGGAKPEAFPEPI